MSVIEANFISSAGLSIMGLFVVKQMNNCKTKMFSILNFLLMSCLIILPAVTHNIQYTYMYSIIVYWMTVITYKYVLNISFPKVIISCALLMLTVSLLDLMISGIVVCFMSFAEARQNIYVCLFSSLIITLIMIYTFSLKKVKICFQKFIAKIEKRMPITLIVFFILIIVGIFMVHYVISENFKINVMFTTTFLVLIIFYLLVIILVNEKNNYDNLTDEYSSLLEYVKVFEDWIENEQLNRHEYKNQLAVLRCMTKEKKVKEKIDDIIKQNINIDSEMISQLKYLPSGGFKGLLYYKIVVARNSKINIDVDVSSNVSKLLKKLDKSQLEVVSKILGIYCDNAIEAARETKNKIVFIEIYDYDDIVNIVISNTFSNTSILENNRGKGISNKGNGRGYGLYFASKMINKNKWLEERQDIIDNFYIQKISIKIENQNTKHSK